MYMATYEGTNTSAVHWKNIKPKIVVFDLDYTLWPYWVDTHVTLPFKKLKNGDVVDARGEQLVCYTDVPRILQKLCDQGIKIGIASRTSATEEARELISLFDWEKFFTYTQIYPGKKTTHFERIHKDSGIDYKDMIFFDDEHRNIVDVGKLGVTAVFVDNGMTHNALLEGMNLFRNKIS